MLAAPEDRALALSLPLITVALGFLLTRIDDRDRAFTVDLVCAGLLAAPGLGCHGWLRLRAFDAASWYVPDQRILGILEQAGAGGASAGILIGAAVALAALRGDRARPLYVGLLAAGLWLGAGSLVLAQLVDQLYAEPSWLLTLSAALTVETGAGAILAAFAVWAATSSTVPTRERVTAVVASAALTAATTVPVNLLADTLDIPSLSTGLPHGPPRPRTVAPIYTPANAPDATELERFLVDHGHPASSAPWSRLSHRTVPWHQALRLGVVLVLPPDTPRATLDALAASAHQTNTLLMALAGRASGLPPGTMDRLLGFPTVELLLDPPPEGAVWGTLHADGTITWDHAPPDARIGPPCGLRADQDVTTEVLTTAVFQLVDKAEAHRCRGIAWPPARCHPDGAGDPLCPSLAPPQP
jgi:hypothetical protein